MKNGGSFRPFASRSGFTLIELLITVAIIGIIAAIAVPRLLDAKKAANEASAIQSVRAISTAQRLYSSTVGAGKYAPTMNLLSPMILDTVLGSGSKDGYSFTITADDDRDYTVVALPITLGVTGFRGFYTDATGVIRYSPDGSAPTLASPPIPR
ncbi:MAG TPA: type II secretion system protein [Acidobacteriota bacterium]|jgi:prepilin-type N-terminal cleavage/methylation domain-containing protein